MQPISAGPGLLKVAAYRAEGSDLTFLLIVSSFARKPRISPMRGLLSQSKAALGTLDLLPVLHTGRLCMPATWSKY